MSWIVLGSKAVEGDSGYAKVSFQVAWDPDVPLPHADAKAVNLDLALKHGTTNTDDIFMVPDSVSLETKGGSAYGTFDVWVRSDRRYEPDETFEVGITKAHWLKKDGATITEDVSASGTGMILNDDEPIPHVDLVDRDPWADVLPGWAGGPGGHRAVPGDGFYPGGHDSRSGEEKPAHEPLRKIDLFPYPDPEPDPSTEPVQPVSDLPEADWLLGGW